MGADRTDAAAAADAVFAVNDAAGDRVVPEVRCKRRRACHVELCWLPFATPAAVRIGGEGCERLFPLACPY